MASSTARKLAFCAFVFGVICINNLSLATLPRPRGVSISRASLYHPEKDQKWQCLDGSKIIKFTQINDEYCDCADASDEPGTAACPNGIFHCDNIGHNGLDIISSKVDDFVCDCCDGSDETGTLQCPNTCVELGRLEDEKREKEAEILKKGTARRNELIKKGKQMKAERTLKKQELERRQTEQSAVKAEKDTLKEAAEAQEAEALELYKEMQVEREDHPQETQEKTENNNEVMRVEANEAFIRLDTNKDGFIEVTELQVDMSLDKDRNGVVTVEEAKYFLDERDRMDFENFLTFSWPRIKPMRMLADGLFKGPNDEAITEEHAELLKDPESHKEEGGVAEAEQSEGGEGEDEDDEEEMYEEDEADTGVGKATPMSSQPITYDPETQRLIEIANEARDAASKAESELRNIENELKEIEEQNKRDYGPNEEYATLDGECFTYEDREYIYTLCPFARATQKPKSGGSETTLGRWDEWVPEGDRKYSKQRYAHGASCWNGPQRSALVKFKCNVENRLTTVAEPNRCEYYFEFETPAACDDKAFYEYREAHDEL